ncbi:hypothetical protein EI94DRAFT_1800131 [Lactarius quietus]|nr:hypothetical protein EI94DRAFT_1800131 [Lactarius quietus]
MSYSLLNLSTELLIHIFAFVPVPDLFSVQSTCHRIYDIVTETAYLQYIVHSHLHGVDDLLPPNSPFSERLELLRHHEKTWNDLQFNLCSKFSTNVDYHSRKNIMQDGYLIYRSNMNLSQYGYIDLFSLQPDEEPRWIHISLRNFFAPYYLVFFVDHDLAVAVREKGMFNGHVLPQLAFFEFTTGAPHPLSAVHTVDIPLLDCLGSVRVEVEVIGDHILAKAVHQHDRCSFYLVSWKIGTVTFLRGLPGMPDFTVFDSDLVMLIRESTNSLDIFKLELASSQPRMRVVCSLGLPPLKSGTVIVNYMFAKEWVASPERHARSPSSQRRRLPFRSSRNDTIALLLNYFNPGRDIHPSGYAVFLGITSLLPVVHSGDRKVPWEKWGPLNTRILPYPRDGMPVPAGPFWITSISPLVIRDYDPLRAVHVRATADNSSPPSRPVFTPLKVVNKYWAAGQVETRLPYREFVSKNIHILNPAEVVGEREWIVVISAALEGTSFTVYHVG